MSTRLVRRHGSSDDSARTTAWAVRLGRLEIAWSWLMFACVRMEIAWSWLMFACGRLLFAVGEPIGRFGRFDARIVPAWEGGRTRAVRRMARGTVTATSGRFQALRFAGLVLSPRTPAGATQDTPR